MRETLSKEQIETLVSDIRKGIAAMREAKLLTRNAIMSHMGKNNAALRSHAETLAKYGFSVGDTVETRKLLIWNEFLGMELERITKIPSGLRKSAAITAKPQGVTRIKSDSNSAVTAFLSGKR